MRLLKEMDKYFTKKKAYEVLSHYRRYARMAGVEYLPKVTATYSLEPKSQGVNRATETMITRRVDAYIELEAIMKAINSIIDPFVRQIIIEKYCAWHIKSDKAIYMDLGYSESEFYRMLDRGCLEFAEAYKSGEIIVYRKFLGDIC